MTKREVMLAIQAFQDFCGLMDRVNEAYLRFKAMGALNLTEIMQEAQQAWGGDLGALNLTEIMQEAQQAWGGDYEQCTEPS